MSNNICWIHGVVRVSFPTRLKFHRKGKNRLIDQSFRTETADFTQAVDGMNRCNFLQRNSTRNLTLEWNKWLECAEVFHEIDDFSSDWRDTILWQLMFSQFSLLFNWHLNTRSEPFSSKSWTWLSRVELKSLWKYPFSAHAQYVSFLSCNFWTIEEDARDNEGANINRKWF